MVLVAVIVSYADPSHRALEFAAPFAFVLVIASFVLFPNTLCVRGLTRDSLLWVGDVSYSIYMVHMFVLFVIEAFLRHALHTATTGRILETSQAVGFASVVAYLACVLGVAALTHRYVEAPGRQLGRDLLKRRHLASRVQTVP
jgi:peptidoglycan/LPS O-acetylase OafA/YrhL